MENKPEYYSANGAPVPKIDASLPGGERLAFNQSFERLATLPAIEAAIDLVTSELIHCDAISYACNAELDVMLVGRSHYDREEEFGRALADPAMRTWSHVNLFEKHGIPYSHALHLPIVFGHIRSLTRGVPFKVSESEHGKIISKVYLTIDLNRGDVSPAMGLAVAKAILPYFDTSTMLVCDPGKFRNVHLSGRLAHIAAETST